VGVQGNVVLVPLAALGCWRLRRHAVMQLAGLYGLALFGVMSFVFTFPGARGGYFHSGAALLPFILTAAVVGLDAAVEAVARRLPHWRPEKSQPIFTTLLVGVVGVLALLLYFSEVIGPTVKPTAWSQKDAVYAEAGQWLAARPEGLAAVAVNNPPGWHYQTGGAANVIPSGDVSTLVRAMDTLGVQWLVLDSNVPAGLVGLYLAPASDPRLALAATFAGHTARPVYLLRRTAAP
jgi:hypothetical protein